MYLILIVRISRCQHRGTVSCGDAVIPVSLAVNPDCRLPRQVGVLAAGSVGRSVACGVEAVGIAWFTLGVYFLAFISTPNPIYITQHTYICMYVYMYIYLVLMNCINI